MTKPIIYKWLTWTAAIIAVSAFVASTSISFSADDRAGEKPATERKEKREEGQKRSDERRKGEGERRGFNLRRPDAWTKAVSVGADGKSINVKRQREGAQPEQLNYTIGDDATILVDGKKGGLDNIEEGAICKLWFTDGKSKVGRLEAEGEKIGGRWGRGVRSIDVGKRTITLGAENPANDQTYAIAKDVEIVIDGKAGTLAELTTKGKVHLKISADMATVVHIRQGENRGREE